MTESDEGTCDSEAGCFSAGDTLVIAACLKNGSEILLNVQNLCTSLYPLLTTGHFRLSGKVLYGLRMPFGSSMLLISPIRATAWLDLL